MKEFKFTVTICLSGDIEGTEEQQYEMAQNIAYGLERQINNSGIAPINEDTITKKLKVKPKGYINQIRIKL